MRSSESFGHEACIPWGGYVAKDGYGKAYNPRTKQIDCAHRVAYERLVGPIPEGHDIDHTCRFRACVNVSHLEPVLHAINCRRGRSTKLSEADVALIRSSAESSSVMGRLLGVDPSTVRKIRRGEHYKEIEGAAEVAA